MAERAGRHRRTAVDGRVELNCVGVDRGCHGGAICEARGAPRLVIAAVALGLALVVAGFAAWPRIMGGAPAVSSAVPVRFTVGPPDKGRLPPPNTMFAFLSLSPDGTTLAFQAEGPTGVNQLWMRKLDSAVAVPIPGTDGALGPFWSPDSRFIGFVADTRLKKVPAAGGPVQTIVELTGVAFGTWNRQGTIVFSSGTLGLMRVSDAGGMSSQVTQLDTGANEVSHSHPNFLPDGEHFLFLVRSALPGRGGVFVSSLGSREQARVLADVSPAVYVEPGYVLFHRDGTLMAQPFDATPARDDGRGGADRGSLNTTHARNTSFAASQNGTVAYRGIEQCAGTSLGRAQWAEEPLPMAADGYRGSCVARRHPHRRANRGAGQPDIDLPFRAGE